MTREILGLIKVGRRQPKCDFRSSWCWYSGQRCRF